MQIDLELWIRKKLIVEFHVEKINDSLIPDKRVYVGWQDFDKAVIFDTVILARSTQKPNKIIRKTICCVFDWGIGLQYAPNEAVREKKF